MKKLYINITNKCNVCCPFCCMDSNKNKQSFMNFEIFYGIINRIDTPTIVQLEGGEPTIHPLLYLFLEYLSTLDQIKEIVIDTNALNLDKQIDKFVEIAGRNEKLIIIKPSYNNYLKGIYENNNPIKFNNYLTNLISACEFIPFIEFEINIRGYNNEGLEILKNDFPQKIKTNCHILNSYGREENNKSLPDLQINNVYDEWECYASDGTCFFKDLKNRAKYEK